MKKTTSLLIALITLALVATACGDDDDTTSSDPVDPAPTDTPAAVDDEPVGDEPAAPVTDDDADMVAETGSWTLTAATVDDADLMLVDDAPVTLVIEGTTVSGISACNNYSADMTVDGDSVTFGPVIATEMACDKGEVMDVEAAYHETLARVTVITQEGEVLVLSGEGVELTFEPTV